MAADAQSAHTGRNLASMAEARARRANLAQAELAAFSQEHLDNLRGFFGSEVAGRSILELILELSQPAFE